MRYMLCLLLCIVPIACAQPAQTPALEHAADAGAKGYMEATVFCPRADGGLMETPKRLPWQSDMESYVLSYVLGDPAVGYQVQTQDGRAQVDIASLPAFTTAKEEAAAIAGIVNTMLAFPGVESVALTFDGARREALPRGTRIETAYTEPMSMDAEK